MSMSKTALLPSLVGAVALTFALALGGCGQTAATETAETTTTEETAEATAEKGADESATTDLEITIPEDLASANETTRSLATSGDTAAAVDFNALPAEELPEADELFDDDELEETDGEETAKPASGYTTLQDGGILMALPSNWLFTQDADGFVFQNQSGKVWGYLYSYSKPSGTRVDVEGLASSVPSTMASRGGTDIEVLGYETRYSDSNTLCSAAVLYSFNANGTTYAHYVQYIESKSYLNIIEFMGDLPSFVNDIDTIIDATDSIVFNYNEMI